MKRIPALLFTAAALASCIGSNPAAPSVRWFDPRPPRNAHDRAPFVRVEAGPFLRQDFVVRTLPHEVAIDDSLRWIAPPEQIVAAALGSIAGLPQGIEVEVVRFEFERASPLRAVVELSCSLGATTKPVVGTADAGDESPEALAAAMAAAIADVARGVAQFGKP